MAELAQITRKMGYKLEQVQDFTPTPMTVSTEMFYTGYDPYTLEPVYTAHSQKDKLAQRDYFFWYKDGSRNSNSSHNSHSSHSTYGNHRTEPRREESQREKRGRNRRHK